MKRKVNWLIYLIVIICSFAIPVTVKADMGPKPSVVIEVIGFEDKEYYVTLLSERNSTGPWSNGNDYYDFMGEEWVFEEFEKYQDKDGYYFLSFMENCSEDDTFEWTYYPPQRFKILVYTTADKQFYCSEEVYERYAFDSYFKVIIPNDGKTGNIITAQKAYDFSMEILSLVSRIVLTIGIELGIAILFRYGDKKSLTIIGLTNIFTQVVLNVLLNVINYRSGEMAFVFHYVWMEMVVFAMEAVVYTKYINKTNDMDKVRYPVMYAAVANLVSIAVGIWIAKVVPGIF